MHPDLSSPDPATPLPGLVCRAMIRDLSLSLPDPVEDTPDARADRDHAAIAEVTALAPADAGELRIAIRCVTADAWTHAFLRLLNTHADDIPTLLRLSAQAAAVGRVANANRALLQRVQAERRRRRPDATPDADERAERHARTMLMQAWDEQEQDLATPLPKAPPVAAPARTTGSPRGRTAEDARWEEIVAKRRRQYEEAMAAGGPEPDWLTPAWRLSLGLPEPPPPTEEEKQRRRVLNEADRYAIIHPLRSRLIRRLGNLPPDCGIEPPAPDLLEAIRTGKETNQLWADRLTPEQAKLNAGRDRDLLWRYEEEASAQAGNPG